MSRRAGVMEPPNLDVDSFTFHGSHRYLRDLAVPEYGYGRQKDACDYGADNQKL
ncbi:MAG TPA: hypothetical protein VG273_02910 [Bryobacteraceae bacterium]|nr:hypothetical protein [Bryobacteraceae bacterium]